MGQTLSVPATDKKTEVGSNDKFAYAVAEMQGWRITMEDSHTAALDLDETGKDSNTWFAVYDGHGGSNVAHYAGDHVHKRLIAEEAYKQKDYLAALKNAFLNTDADMKADPAFIRDTSGCTAITALITNDNRIFVANAGDSRSVISVKGEVKPLSFDHKPVNETERSRIGAAGGYVEFGRVNGNLALARALGDFEYKKNATLAPEAQIITCNPEITEHPITEEDEFLVLACDGIWDCLTSQQVVDAIRLLVSQGKKLAEIGEIICDHCLAPDTNSGSGFGCDNMTILIVAILHGKTEEEWYQWVTERTNQSYGYNTPKELPQLYPAGRLEAFRRRHAAFQANEARRKENQEVQNNQFQGQGIQPPIVRFLGALTENGLQNSPMYGFLSGNSDDMDEDDDDDEEHEHHDIDLLADSPAGKDEMTERLRKQLDELDSDTEDELEDSEGSEKPVDSESKKELQGEAPPPPSQPDSIPNGVAHQPQLKSDPGGDAPSDAVRAEGLLDKSEDPLKAAA
ncbi:hypothetical protein QCA50_006733 [Cerrena zonata]|uniref:protein-serine/threonine phosphatase n=1 Tax=Cerrena zonata TaxID=2478898 RepID=A0AAW0GJM3_9APHY